MNQSAPAHPKSSASSRSRRSRRSRASTGVGLLALALAVSSGCHGADDKNKSTEATPTSEGRATSRELLTKVGLARALQLKNKDVAGPSTAIKWPFVLPIDANNALIGGSLIGEAIAVRTEDGGKTWTTLRAIVDADAMITYSASADGAMVMAVAKRQIPKKKLAKDAIPPIDSLTLYFQVQGDKLSAPSPILAPNEKGTGPVIPKGLGHQAMLSKSLTSFAIEMEPKVYGVAYGGPPTDALPNPMPIPKGETPVFAAYARPPMLVTMNEKEIMVRPWPAPGEAFAPTKPIEHLVMTKTLQDELSQGPECEDHEWSFRRVSQPNNKTFVVAISKDKATSFELPGTAANDKPMGCSGERVVIEALDPTNNEPALVTCKLDGTCAIPQNHAFLRPWPDKHDGQLAITTFNKGVIAVSTMSNPSQWTYLLTESGDGGNLYDLQRAVGDGKGDRGRFEIGALVGLGSRTLMMLSAEVTGTTQRNWFMMASDDGGQTWTAP